MTQNIKLILNWNFIYIFLFNFRMTESQNWRLIIILLQRASEKPVNRDARGKRVHRQAIKQILQCRQIRVTVWNWKMTMTMKVLRRECGLVIQCVRLGLWMIVDCPFARLPLVAQVPRLIQLPMKECCPLHPLPHQFQLLHPRIYNRVSITSLAHNFPSTITSFSCNNIKC